MKSKYVIAVSAAIVLLFAIWVSAAGHVVDHKSALSGKVVADRLTQAGARVHEGDVLVVVQTLTGSAPAVRSTLDGTVAEVLIQPGEQVRAGDVLIRVEAAQK